MCQCVGVVVVVVCVRVCVHVHVCVFTLISYYIKYIKCMNAVFSNENIIDLAFMNLPCSPVVW